MRNSRLFWLGVIVLFLASAVWLGSRSQVARAQESTATSKRITDIQVTTIVYDWWLVYWSNNQVACEVSVEHEGVPTPQEVNDQCGKTIYNQWQNTKICDLQALAADPDACTGLYLHKTDSHVEQKEITVELPLASVNVSLTGCNSVENGPCIGSPKLKFTATEPLPNEQIIRIQGELNGNPFSCPGSVCEVSITPTGNQGVSATFWADSSFGDSTEKYTAQVRMIPWGDFANPDKTSKDQPAYYVDVLSSQWQGERTDASCSEIWQVFPDISGPPAWLQTPKEASGLQSGKSLYYLSAMLIHNGSVDASECENNGLASWNTANECGVDAASAAATAWQNSFDEEIIKVARDTGIPAQLMKNVFTRESQLWPGIYWNYDEAGLGQLTENGADTVLLWNPTFFSQFCPLVLSSQTCELGFGNLEEEDQALLRGALVKKVNSSCETCPMGIDLSQANFSINVFAQTLLANCEQVNRMIYNTTQRSPAETSNYVDLWRFTLINYNAGPGCLGNSLERTYDDGSPLDWEHVVANLEPVCRDSVKYALDISEGSIEEIPVFNTPLPTPTITRTPTLTPTPTITPTPTETATPTVKP